MFYKHTDNKSQGTSKEQAICYIKAGSLKLNIKGASLNKYLISTELQQFCKQLAIDNVVYS